MASITRCDGFRAIPHPLSRIFAPTFIFLAGSRLSLRPGGGLKSSAFLPIRAWLILIDLAYQFGWG
jgi:uncharacterized membrane protein